MFKKFVIHFFGIFFILLFISCGTFGANINLVSKCGYYQGAYYEHSGGIWLYVHPGDTITWTALGDCNVNPSNNRQNYSSINSNYNVSGSIVYPVVITAGNSQSSSWDYFRIESSSRNGNPYWGNSYDVLFVQVKNAGTQVSSAVTVSTSNSSINYFSTLTVSASITPSNATGSITFYSDGIAIGSSPVYNGSASLSFTANDLSIGSHSITAKYNGDTNYLSSQSVSSTVNVIDAPYPTQSVASKTLTKNTAATSFTPVTGSGGTSPLSYSVSPSLPSGLSLNSSTGAITGTPTVTSSATSYTVTVTDANSASATNTFSLTVSDVVTATQSVVSTTLTKNTVATSFTPVTGSGGTSPLTYSVSPSLPSGLSLNSSTGAITGTPTVTSSATSYTVTVTDANSASATNTFSLTVSDVVTGTADTTAQSFRVGTAISNFTPLTGTGGTAPLTYYVSLGTLPTGLSLNSSTGILSGTPTATYSAANVVFAVKDANNSISSTTSTVSFTVSAALTSTTTTLTASSNSPVSGQSVTFTATVSPSAASGTVTFKDSGTTLGTSNLSSGVATFSTSSLSTSSHSITATYNGDTNYATSTSGTQTVTPYTRSNPVSDANVRGIINAHFTTPIQVTQTQIATLESRLEALHHDEVDGFINGFHFSVSSNSNNLVNQYRDPLDDLNDQSEFARLFPEYYQDRNLDEPPDKVEKLNSLPKANQQVGLTPDVHIWTSGSLTYGTESYSGQSSNNRFRLSGASIGIDTLIDQNIKAGFSLGFSDDHTDINTDGSKNSGRTWLLSSYASYNPTKNVYLDGFLGAGTFSFDTTRYDSNSTSFMTGRRPGWMLFGGLIASVEQRYDNLKIIPYGSYNFSQINLNEFSEDGSSTWTLNYQSAKYITQNITLGIRGEYDFEMPWGVISPTFRFGFQTALNTDATQVVSYSDDQSSTYTLTQSYMPNQIYLGGIGLMINTNKSFRSQIEYIYSASGSTYSSNRFQYSVKVPL